MADHHVLNGDQGQEQYEAHDVVAADHKLPEGFDHMPGGARAFVAVQQNASAAGQVQGQPEQRQQQQEAGKNGELDGPENLHRRQQHQHRCGNADGQEQVEQQSRQWHQHDEDQRHGCDGNDPLREPASPARDCGLSTVFAIG